MLQDYYHRLDIEQEWFEHIKQNEYDRTERTDKVKDKRRRILHIEPNVRGRISGRRIPTTVMSMSRINPKKS